MNKLKPILSWGGLALILFLIAYAFNTNRFAPEESALTYFASFEWFNKWPRWMDIPMQSWFNDGIKWLTTNLGWFFDIINNSLVYVLSQMQNLLTFLPWPIVIGLFAAVAWFASGGKKGTTILVAVCLFLIGFLSPKFWDLTLQTTAIMLVSIMLCLVIGLPVGIKMARSERFRTLILPVLDLMQTIPAFCYLIPGIMLFGLGAVPAIIATFIYAVPPVARLTDLGIRLVDEEVMEAADSFGATRKQKLFDVQLPLALPNIMQGINQTTLMALAMVVIASMIGTRGIGSEVLLGLQQLNVGRAAESGIAIVLLAIIFDRITQSYGERLQERAHTKQD
ncbi:MAG: glycine betaine/proline transport system permease protein [Saprospiraceae bacterium]|jgi:glycine betaine/proline transport system permease protein